MEKLVQQMSALFEPILNYSKQLLENESRLKAAIDSEKKDRLKRKNEELTEEIKNAMNRGTSINDKTNKSNFMFIFGCRPSTGVIANTTMVQDIYDAFIENADRINFEVRLPKTLDYLDGKDANFETSSSARLDTIKLYYLHNIAAHSLALVFANHTEYDNTHNSEIYFSEMLKKSLKVERVHTYINLSFSQLQEKMTWVI